MFAYLYVLHVFITTAFKMLIKITFFFFRVAVKERDLKVNIFDMAGHPIFYEASFDLMAFGVQASMFLV